MSVFPEITSAISTMDTQSTVRRSDPSQPEERDPQEPPFDKIESILDIVWRPYEFISNRCEALNVEAFQTRLMLSKVVCVRGSEAAAMFYDNLLFERAGAVPNFIIRSLFGQGGVQGLDGEPHKHRKQMFLSLITEERVEDLAKSTEKYFFQNAQCWINMAQVNFYEAIQVVLTQAVCEWAGVPLLESEVQQRSHELSALFDAAGSIGVRNLWSQYSRWRAERWISDIVRQVRDGSLRSQDTTTALYQIATHRELDGNLLDLHTAAVEILNVLRPIVAISVYAVFVAHALHKYPEYLQRLKSTSSDDYLQCFVQEVRRMYPFFPFLIARTRQDFTWKGLYFPAGRLVVLDLYGTNHNSKDWEEPFHFRPERFLSWNKSPFNLIPQGGGSHSEGHRCPGEQITIRIMKLVTQLIASERVTYNVPPQNLSLDMSRLPALPRDRFILTNVAVHLESPSRKQQEEANMKGTVQA